MKVMLLFCVRLPTLGFSGLSWLVFATAKNSGTQVLRFGTLWSLWSLWFTPFLGKRSVALCCKMLLRRLLIS